MEDVKRRIDAAADQLGVSHQAFREVLAKVVSARDAWGRPLDDVEACQVIEQVATADWGGTMVGDGAANTATLSTETKEVSDARR